MSSNFSQNVRGQERLRRTGLSFVEFVGCLVAMVGGVALGSVFLGIDMKDMAVGVLERANINTPSFLRSPHTSAEPAASPGVPAQSATEEEADAENPAAAGQQQEQPVQEPEPSKNVTDDATESGDTAPTVVLALEATPEERLQATRKYWDALTNCMVQEAQSRLEKVSEAEELQLYDYLLHRKRNHEQALNTLTNLETFGVDDRLLTHGKQVIAWHTSGMQLYERALALLTDGPSSDIAGPFAQSWQSASTQLRMEEGLVLEKNRAVAAYLDHTYPEEAPFNPAFP